MPAPALEVEAVSVRFGGLAANQDVTLSVREGTITALIGPNGAGKTTLFNVISGAQAPSAGRVRLGGTDITRASTVKRARLGMARTFQNLSLLPALTALENVGLGVSRFRHTGLPGALLRLPSSRRSDHAVEEVARGALDFVGLAEAAHRPADALPYGARRRLELARALALEPRLLLLDEPSAGMGPGETAQLTTTIRRAVDELDVTVLLVEHDMTFVRALASETVVLDFGTVIAAGATDEVLAEPAVAEAYLGTPA